ncbi:MAG: hypothetical protein A2Z42_01045 [Candidatus Woykebacteria bacterium RBG_19FT_COMBO_43_10]|uniref:Uncharacterized protein n=1 Tax=Candidatus Woykebacteria bacterium RBG_19FT_COMBO_43_10 TaxID=1802598 RepID=A0A1G1WKT4_9BACT|nr:MAG: hypothetical protein A2Z42_01045 [Candidatus Woykebacteria bacterium RBG_19FT_COMBO_43_10]
MEDYPRTKLQSIFTYSLPLLVIGTLFAFIIGGGYLAREYFSGLKRAPNRTNTSDPSPNKLQVTTPKKTVAAPQTSKSKTRSDQNNATNNQTTVKKPTAPPETPKYVAVIQPFAFKNPVETQATFSIDFDVDITDKFQIRVQHPDGRFLDINKLQHDLYGSVFVFSVQPTDPYVSPIPGTWKLHFSAPEGSTYVIGVTQF